MLKQIASMTSGMLILWCYTLWYLFFFVVYFNPDPDLWSRSVGIGILVGFALNINSFGSVRGVIYARNKWQVFRFIAVPFCVSSFPVFIQGKGFFLFFSPKMIENVYASGLCLLFLSITFIIKNLYSFDNQN